MAYLLDKFIALIYNDFDSIFMWINNNFKFDIHFCFEISSIIWFFFMKNQHFKILFPPYSITKTNFIGFSIMEYF